MNEKLNIIFNLIDNMTFTNIKFKLIHELVKLISNDKDFFKELCTIECIKNIDDKYLYLLDQLKFKYIVKDYVFLLMRDIDDAYKNELKILSENKYLLRFIDLLELECHIRYVSILFPIESYLEMKINDLKKEYKVINSNRKRFEEIDILLLKKLEKSIMDSESNFLLDYNIKIENNKLNIKDIKKDLKIRILEHKLLTKNN